MKQHQKQQRRQAIKTIGAGIAASWTTSVASAASFASAAPDKPTKSAPIRIGQIGVGHAHASKLAVYRSSPVYEVVGVVEPDPELRLRAQSQPLYRDLPWMTQEQLLNVPGIQAVLVETRVRDLLTTAEACISAGKHIHLDKPAGASLPHFRRIVESAEKQKLLIQMGYMYRYNPGIAMLREFLKKGWLGEVFEVHTVMSKIVDPESRKGLAEFPGGIMFELGGHIIDLVVGIMGKPASVTAFPRTSAVANDGLVDNMLAVFSYPRATATVKTAAIEVDGGDRRHLVVCGTEGTFHIQPLDNPAVRMTLSRPRDTYPKGYQDIRLPRYVRYVDDAADMARILRGEKETDFSYEHDLNVQTALLQASAVSTDT
jgi:predicted dehydrogenase